MVQVKKDEDFNSNPSSYSRLPSYHLHDQYNKINDNVKINPLVAVTRLVKEQILRPGSLPKYEDVPPLCENCGACGLQNEELCEFCPASYMVMEECSNFMDLHLRPTSREETTVNSSGILTALLCCVLVISFIEITLVWPFWVVDYSNRVTYGLYKDNSYLLDSNHLVQEDNSGGRAGSGRIRKMYMNGRGNDSDSIGLGRLPPDSKHVKTKRSPYLEKMPNLLDSDHLVKHDSGGRGVGSSRKRKINTYTRNTYYGDSKQHVKAKRLLHLEEFPNKSNQQYPIKSKAKAATILLNIIALISMVVAGILLLVSFTFKGFGRDTTSKNINQFYMTIYSAGLSGISGICLLASGISFATISIPEHITFGICFYTCFIAAALCLVIMVVCLLSTVRFTITMHLPKSYYPVYRSEA